MLKRIAAILIALALISTGVCAAELSEAPESGAYSDMSKAMLRYAGNDFTVSDSLCVWALTLGGELTSSARAAYLADAAASVDADGRLSDARGVESLLYYACLAEAIAYGGEDPSDFCGVDIAARLENAPQSEYEALPTLERAYTLIVITRSALFSDALRSTVVRAVMRGYDETRKVFTEKDNPLGTEAAVQSMAAAALTYYRRGNAYIDTLVGRGKDYISENKQGDGFNMANVGFNATNSCVLSYYSCAGCYDLADSLYQMFFALRSSDGLLEDDPNEPGDYRIVTPHALFALYCCENGRPEPLTLTFTDEEIGAPVKVRPSAATESAVESESAPADESLPEAEPAATPGWIWWTAAGGGCVIAAFAAAALWIRYARRMRAGKEKRNEDNGN